MAEGSRRRIAVVAAVSAVVLGTTTVAVLVANAAVNGDQAAPVAASIEYPPLESDVLSD
jgi:hypothetical protein